MANKDFPCGLKPHRHMSGGLIRAGEHPIASGYNTNIFTGDAVKLTTNGVIELAASKKERKKINRNLDTLEQLALERSGELAEFVKGVRKRIIDVLIAEKFAKLAQELFPVEAEQDIHNFKTIKDIRDALVHGTKGQVPREFRGKNVIQAVAELAHRYFLTASGRALGIKVQLKIPDKFLEPTATISAHFGLILPSRSDG